MISYPVRHTTATTGLPYVLAAAGGNQGMQTCWNGTGWDFNLRPYTPGTAKFGFSRLWTEYSTAFQRKRSSKNSPFTMKRDSGFRSSQTRSGRRHPSSKKGYYGNPQGAPLHNFLAENSGKRCVVLLDEFEKTMAALPQAFLLMFQNG